MPKSVREYLVQLKQALKGSDRALVQDALSDAEEHLQTALENTLMDSSDLTEAEALESIIEKYGNPVEVAAAYRAVENRLAPALAPSKTLQPQSVVARFFGITAEPRAWGGFLYALLSCLTGIIYCAWVVIGGCFSLLSLLFIIGVPIAGAFLLSLRGIALMEGRIVEALLGVRMPRKSLFVSRDLKWAEKLKALFTESHTWKALVYLVLQFPLGLIYLFVIGGLFVISLSFITSPVMELAFHLPLELLGTDAFTPAWLLPVVCAAGIFLLPLTLHVAKLLGKLHGHYAKALLVRK